MKNTCKKENKGKQRKTKENKGRNERIVISIRGKWQPSTLYIVVLSSLVTLSLNIAVVQHTKYLRLGILNDICF